MRSIGLLIVAAMVLASPASAKSWIKFADPDGHFSVLFPFAPKVAKTSTTGADGLTIPITMYLAAEDRVSMILMVSDYGGRNIDSQAGLDAVVAHFSSSPDYVMENSQTDTLDGQVGRFFTVFDKTRGVRVSDRVFSFGNRLYQALTGTASKARAGELADAKKFRDSVHFLPLVSKLGPNELAARLSADPNPAALATDPSASAQCSTQSDSVYRQIGSVGGSGIIARPGQTFRQLLIGDVAEMEGCGTANAFAASIASH